MIFTHYLHIYSPRVQGVAPRPLEAAVSGDGATLPQRGGHVALAGTRAVPGQSEVSTWARDQSQLTWPGCPR